MDLLKTMQLDCFTNNFEMVYHTTQFDTGSASNERYHEAEYP